MHAPRRLRRRRLALALQAACRARRPLGDVLREEHRRPRTGLTPAPVPVSAAFVAAVGVAPRAELFAAAPGVYRVARILRGGRGRERDDAELLVFVPGGIVELGLWVRLCRGRGRGAASGRTGAGHDAGCEGGVHGACQRPEEESSLAAEGGAERVG